jgi:sensor histidine kinase YesM
MTCIIDPTEAQPSGSRSPQITAIIRKQLWIVPSVALLCLVLLLTIGRTKLSESGIELVVTFIYAALISLPSAVLLTKVAHRYSERFPRFIIVLNALVLLGTATCGTFVGAWLLLWIGIIPHGRYWMEIRSAYPISVVISLMVGLGITSVETLRYKLQVTTLELRTRQVEQERAYKLLAEARLSSLESRIHPHFLFNTLNSIAALIPSDPQRAEDTVGKLASLLRFSLSANQSGLVLLSQELKIVRDYLEIERTRFGSRLRYEIAVPDELTEVSVPPLALQSLVENAVKHVVAQRNQGASIRIHGARVAGRVMLAVSDDGPGFTLAAITPEHGLGNLIARLELLFGTAGQLEVARENDRTIVRLSFPA